jgi:hypothetical protein
MTTVTHPWRSLHPEVAGEDLATNVNHFTLDQSGPAHHLSEQQKIGDGPLGTLPSNGGRYIRQSRDRGKFHDALVRLLRPGRVMGSGPKICRVEREARVDYTATLQTEAMLSIPLRQANRLQRIRRGGGQRDKRPVVAGPPSGGRRASV